MAKLPSKDGPKISALTIHNSKVMFRNCVFTGHNSGVIVSGDSTVAFENNAFDGVREPFDIDNAGWTKVQGTRIFNDPTMRQEGIIEKAEAITRFHQQRLSGPRLPVFCSNCKTVFPSRLYKYEGPSFLLWDNEEPCQVCSFEHAKLSEGIFDLTGQVARIISAPDFTHAMFVALINIASNLQSGAIGTNQAIHETELVSVSLAAILLKAFKYGMPVVWSILLAIPGVLSLHMQYTSTADASLETIATSTLRQEAYWKNLLEKYPPVSETPALRNHDAPINNLRKEKRLECQAVSEASEVSSKNKSRIKSRHSKHKAKKKRRMEMRGLRACPPSDTN